MPNPQKLGIEMAGDRAHKDYKSNPPPILTSIFLCYPLCSLCMPDLIACTLPSLYLVAVVFGTAIPTSLYSFGNVFHTGIEAQEE